MSRVTVVTDSTSDLSAEAAKRLGVLIVPLSVLFGDETFRDGVDLSSDEFLTKLKNSPHHPRTSQPSAGDFAQVYEGILNQSGNSDILSIHISAALSGTFQSASLARDLLSQQGKPGSIELIDSKVCSAALGLLVEAAAGKAAAGAGLGEIASWARSYAPSVRCFFAPDTLEYLEKGGRIGKAAAFLGGLLSVKPILALDDGHVAPRERVRGRDKVQERLVQLAQGAVPGGGPVRVTVIHAGAREAAEKLRDALLGTLRVQGEIGLCQLSPVIAAHTGPGTLGVAVGPSV